MPTLKVREVARKLSLSPGTVSKALNGNTVLVSVHTAQRVLDYCFKKGYLTKAEVDRTIFKLKSQSSDEDKAIFCATSYQGCWGFDAVFSSISDYLQDQGQYVTHLKIRETGSLSRLPFEKIGALIVLGHVQPDIFSVLKNFEVPLIMVDEWTDNEEISTVNSDNLQAMSRAVDILAKLGHERIAFMAYLDKDGAIYNQRQRHSGYIVGMTNAGLIYQDLIFQKKSHFDYSDTSHQDVASELSLLAEEILTCENRPTAVVAMNDLNANILRQVARKMGLDVPGDLSVIGYDGQHQVPHSGVYFEPVSTMAVDFQEMGRQAVELAVQFSVDSSMRARHLLVPTKYEDNGTVAPPRI